MTIKRYVAALAASVIVAALCAGAAVAAEKPFVLTSKTFRDGAMMPRKLANDTKGNPNCVGQNISPELSWRNAPADTKSFALVMVDLEARAGLRFFHWVAYGIPASVTSFKEGEVSAPSDKYVGGRSTLGVGFYSGPCVPPGTPHHFSFVVIATDLDPKALPPGLTYPELMEKLEGHAKRAAGIIGRFVAPG